MRRAVGLTSDELETRERVFDGLTTRAIRRSLRALSSQLIMTAATELTLSAEPPPPNPTIPAGALGVVTTTWTQEVDDVLFPYVVQTFVDAAEDVHAALPAGVPKITYDLAVTYLAGARNRLAGIGDVIWNDMRTQLALGYEAGESITQLATRLRQVAKISEPHAQMIARTEVVPAANFGSLQQLKVAEFTDDECQKEWLATDDARTREAHRLADGQRVGVNQPFVVDGDFLQVPGDPSGRPENVINCRCTVAYVFADDDGGEVDAGPLTADARFEALHPRADDGRFGVKSPFTILPKELRGKSGDGMYAPGMWGRYGAAGVMMRHVDERGTPRYLLVQRANPGGNQWKWQLPGGALEQNETPAQGAAREAFEEIGATPELLESLTLRGEHTILRPVKDKDPWRYTNVVANSPTRFTPRVDRKEGELWKAVWLTEDQIREMMTRNRLVAPLAAEIDSILAKYDEPLVAGFNVITMTAGASTVTNRDYYDLMTAAGKHHVPDPNWDESQVKRDTEGKFAKEAGLKKLAQEALTPAKPLHINTKVIYTTKYADGTVVAEKNYAYAGPSRLVWDAGQKKFLLQSADANDNWTTVKAYTKKDAYAKFSNETDWFEPVALAAPDTLHEAGKKAAQKTVDPTKSPAKPPSQTASLGTPIKINTVAIYKTKYADGAVVAEKIDVSAEQRLVWDAKKKKFILQKIDGAMWVPQQEYNKNEAYQKFSKQTGWTQPVESSKLSATPAVTPAVTSIATLKSGVSGIDTLTGFEKLSKPDKVTWLAHMSSSTLHNFTHSERQSLQVHVNWLFESGAISKTEHTHYTAIIGNLYSPGNTATAAPSVDVPAPMTKLTDIIAAIMSVDSFAGFINLSPEQRSIWLTKLDDANIANFTPEQLSAVSDYVVSKYSAGDVSKSQFNHFNNVVNSLKAKSITKTIPDFLSDPSHLIDKFFEDLTQDDFDALSPSDQAVIANEVPTWGDTYEKKIKSFIAGKGDSADVNPVLESALLMMTQSEYESLSKDEKIKLYEDVQGLSDPTGAIEKKLNDLIKTHIETHSPGTTAPTPRTPVNPPVSTLAPAASKFHVDVHGKIKKVSEIGTPKPLAKNAIYSIITPTQADKLQKSMFADSGAWSAGQLAAIKKYGTSVGYRSMNAVLRDDKKQLQLFSDAQLSSGVKHAVNLQNAMKPLPSSLRLFRGTGAHAFGQNTIAADFTKLKALEGQTLTDKGFFSTTVDETKAVSYDYAKKPIQMIVNTPEGTPAVYADAGIPGHSEHEIILAAGTSYRIDEVRKATAEDRAKFGSGTQHVVVATVVPSTSVSSTPINAPASPDPAVAPSVMTLVTPSAPTAPTLGPIKASDLKKPVKITTKMIHTTKYQHGAVVAYRKDVGGLARLVWSDTTKKFILQRQDPDGTWVNFTGHSKKDAYAEFAKGIVPWYEPPAGDSAIGSGGVFGTSSVAPKISTSGPTPSTAVTAPAAKPKPQPKFDVTTLQAQHGQIPAGVSNTIQREVFNDFKKNSGLGFITLSSNPENVFEALKATLDKHNETYKTLPDGQLNLLQLLRIIDEQSTSKATANAKKNDADAPEIANTNAYEKKVVDWLQTPSGAKFATDLLHPPAPAVVNGHVYKSNFSPAVLDTLAKIKTPGQIGTPDPNATTFKTLNVSAAQTLQNQMLASNPWTSAQKAALAKYSTSYYSEMNPVIRDITSDVKYKSEDAKMLAARTAVNVQAGMRPLPESVRVFRRTNASQFPGLTAVSGYADIKKLEGKLFVDRAPLSTSVSPGTWSGNVRMTIDLPAGTPAAFIKSISANPNEDEMLLALGLNYRVVSVTDTGYNNVIEVHLRVEA